MRLVQLLQFPHILLQRWVLIEIIQHVMIQSLEGNYNVYSSHIKFTSQTMSTLFQVHRIPYLHKQFDVLVLPQEIFAKGHPLRHQVQDLPFPLQSLFPVLLPSVSLGAIGGFQLRLQHRWRVRYCIFADIKCRQHEAWIKPVWVWCWF